MSIRLLGVKEHAKEESLAEQRKKTYRHPHMGCRHTHAHPLQVSTHDHVDADSGLFFFHYFTVALVFGIFEGEKKKERKHLQTTS